MTYFQAEKLYHFGGGRNPAQHQSSPYRVTTYVGPELGLVGALPAALYRLHGVNTADAANQQDWNPAQFTLLQKIRRHCQLRRQA